MYQSLQHPTKNWGRVRFFRSEHWGLKRFCGMLKVTQHPEGTVLIWICIKYNHTLCAQPGSVLHLSFWFTFNIFSAGCEWPPTGPHISTRRPCECATHHPLFIHSHSMRFSSHMTQASQSAYSTPTLTPDHSDWDCQGSLWPLGQPNWKIKTDWEPGGHRSGPRQGRYHYPGQCPSPALMGLCFPVTWPDSSLCCWHLLELTFCLLQQTVWSTDGILISNPAWKVSATSQGNRGCHDKLPFPPSPYLNEYWFLNLFIGTKRNMFYGLLYNSYRIAHCNIISTY